MPDHKLQIILSARDVTKSAFLSAQGRVAAFTKSVFSMRGALVAVAGAGAMGVFVKKSLEAADAIGKAADVIGISTDALQEYRHAARIAGVSTELMDNSFKAFSKRVGEARNETGALVTFLKKFDEQLLKNIQSSGSTEEALNLFMDRMGKTANQTDRAALAAAAFSRSGLVLTNMVKDGAAGLEKMRREARDLGIVMDEQLIRQSEKANDEIEKLTRVLKVQFMSAAVGLAPEIAKIAKSMTDWYKVNQDIVKQDVVGWMNAITEAAKIGFYPLRAWADLFAQIGWRAGGGKGTHPGSMFGPEVPKIPKTTPEPGAGTDGQPSHLPTVLPSGLPGGGGTQPPSLDRLDIGLADFFKDIDDYSAALDEAATGQAEFEAALQSTSGTAKTMGEQLRIGVGEYIYVLPEIENATKETFSALENMSLRTSDAMEDNFSSFFKDFFRGELDSAEDYFKAFCYSLTDSFADMMGQMAKEMLFGGGSSGGGGFLGSIFSGFSGLFGGGGTPGTLGGLTEFQTAGALFHAGGMVGKDLVPTRSVPASLFAHAPRLHRGLAGDEFPAILQRGETVIPRGQTVSQVKNLTVISNLTIEGDMDRRAASLHLSDVEEKVRSVMREEMR